ncbi:MAG: hypothetical protein JF563_01765 [Acidobacteriales bacterium]|nr:hypothetical protein [Terriglobales bacterium]
MLLARANWLPSFAENGKRLFASGTVYDFSSANPLRFDLVNAQVLLSQLLSSQMSQFVAVGITVSVVLLWLHFRKTAAHQSRLLDLAILSAAMLVPLYHRFYDAGLLIFAVAWAIKELSISASKYAILTLVAATPFLIPGAAVLRFLAKNNSAVAGLSETFWWKFLIAPHQAWMVLIILTVLLGAQRALCAQKVQATTVSCSAEAA